MNVRVSDKLKEILESKGLSRCKLAEMCGIADKTLQRAMHGRPIRLEIAQIISEKLNIDISNITINDEEFTNEQNDVILCGDDEVQTVAGPGSGKTKTLVGKVMELIKSGVTPKSIVVFTFTEKAADELNYRIKRKLNEEKVTVPGISEMYIGTIHGFCLVILQEVLDLYKDYDVLTPVRNRIFVDKYFRAIGVNKIKRLDNGEPMKIYIDTNRFLQLAEILNENEVNWAKVPIEIVDAYNEYGNILKKNKHFDFTSIMSEAYKELKENEKLRNYVKESINHLIVDEYQDVNYLQERIICEIHSLGSKLLVVGDLDQNIYSWRGSDVENFLYFDKRYKNAKKFFLGKNFRSTQAIVDISNKIIKNNVKRDQNLIVITDNNTYDIGDCIYKEFTEPQLEAEFIIDRIKELNSKVDVPYREIAVLVRTNRLANDIIEEMERNGVPYIVQGVNKLFETKEIKAAVAIFQYLCKGENAEVLERLWINAIPNIKLSKIKEGIDYLRTIDLGTSKLYGSILIQRVYWDYISILDIMDGEMAFDLSKERILYNLGKFSQVINDYESINYKVVPEKRFMNFCKFIEISAEDYYPEGYLENPYIKIDGVRVMTVHQSKGLEFTAVFVPGLSNNLFPHQKIGGLSIWHYLPDYCVKNSCKFKGGDEEAERRLFYVAVTRSMKFLILSRAKYGRNTAKPSPFLREVKKSYYILEHVDENNLYDNIPKWKALPEKEALMSLSFSTLSDYYECPFRFKLSHLYGFVQYIDEKMNYGNSMHSIVSDINKAYAAGGSFSDEELKELAKDGLYLPYLDDDTRFYENLEKRCIDSTVSYYKTLIDDKNATIEYVEQKIEVPITDSLILKGRIDLVKKVDKISNKLQAYIVDFKTQSDDKGEKSRMNDIALRQLLIYCLGYEQLTGNKADFIQLHNLDADNVETRPVMEANLVSIAEEVKTASDDIRNNVLHKKCLKEKCEKCYMKYICISKNDAKKHNIILDDDKKKFIDN